MECEREQTQKYRGGGSSIEKKRKKKKKYMSIDYYQMGSRNRIAFDENKEGKRWGRHIERVNNVKGKNTLAKITTNTTKYAVGCLWRARERERNEECAKKLYKTKRSEMLHTQNKNGSKGRHQIVLFDSISKWLWMNVALKIK